MDDESTQAVTPSTDGAFAAVESGLGPSRTDRPLPSPAPDRRGRDGRGLRGRAAGADPAPGRAEDRQARHGHAGVRRPLRIGTPGPGDDGSSVHREGLRRRRLRARPALLRDGVRRGHPHHGLLRRAPAEPPATARTPRPGLRGRPARPPEGDHPPRHQADQRPGDRGRRQAGAQDHRLRRGQGDGPVPDGPDGADQPRPADRHAGVHEPRAGEPRRQGHRHPHRRLCPRRPALRTPGERATLQQAGIRERGTPGGAPQDPRGRAAAAERPRDHHGDVPGRGRARPRLRAVVVAQAPARGSRLDHHEGAGEGPDPALRHRQRAGPRHPALPARRTGAGRAAEHGVHGAQVRQAPPYRRRRRRLRRRGGVAGDRRHHHRPHPRGARRTHGHPRGHHRHAGVGLPRGPLRGVRSRPVPRQHHHGPRDPRRRRRPRRERTRRPAADPGQVDEHHRQGLSQPRSLRGREPALAEGARLAPAATGR